MVKFIKAKQTIILLIASILLIIVILFATSDRTSTIGRNTKYFAINDTSRIKSIIIGGSDTLVLQRSGTEWILNDNFQADQNAINNFLFVFSRLKIKGVFGATTLKDELQITTISFKEDNKFRVMRYQKINGMDILQRSSSDLFFQAEVSGFPDISINDVVKDNSGYWRNHLLFSVPPDNIRSIKLNYPSESDFDFMILNRNDSLLLRENKLNSFYPVEIVNQEKLRMYFSYFMNIFFEDFLSEKDGADSVFNNAPDFQIEIEEISGNILKLGIWPLYRNAVLDENFVYLRKNNDREILIAKHVLADLWRKEKIDFLYK